MRLWFKLVLFGLFVLMVGGGYFYYQLPVGHGQINNFQECIDAENPAMESYPRRCMADGKTFVEEVNSLLEPTLSVEEAFAIADGSQECAMTGILTDKYIYNPNSKTWWISLDRMPELEKDGCNPTCVVFEEKKEAEINWMCAGAVSPANKNDLIILENLWESKEITSPLIVEGRARGAWYFEGNFPLILTDWDGKIIAEGYATAQGEWMTEDFVPFKGTIEFEKPEVIKGVLGRGALILKKNNPSGLPEYDDALEVPILFK